ncbi:hypothetical protein QLX08_006269 [Tetragonisca angustula]|uniref:Uncharacterized protein n=1 Tax=Tetragonisca angustula TaxID=166442 RepID=A0AAW0ZVT0_9HYME
MLTQLQHNTLGSSASPPAAARTSPGALIPRFPKTPISPLPTIRECESHEATSMRRLATRPEGPGGISISFFSKQDSIEDEGWTLHRTNRAIQPKQGPSSQVSGTFLTRDGWVRVLPREWKKNLIVLVDKATAQT